MLDEVEDVLKATKEFLLTNYTHVTSDFSWPASYESALIRENYSEKPADGS